MEPITPREAQWLRRVIATLRDYADEGNYTPDGAPSFDLDVAAKEPVLDRGRRARDTLAALDSPSSPEPTGGEAPDVTHAVELLKAAYAASRSSRYRAAMIAAVELLENPPAEVQAHVGVLAPAPAPTGGREARELWLGRSDPANDWLILKDPAYALEQLAPHEGWEVRRFREVLSETDTPRPEGGDDAAT